MLRLSDKVGKRMHARFNKACKKGFPERLGTHANLTRNTLTQVLIPFWPERESTLYVNWKFTSFLKRD